MEAAHESGCRMNTTKRSSGWIEAKVCSVCEHNGWCRITADGGMRKCMRCPNEYPVKQKDGTVGYLYPADASAGPVNPRLRAVSTPPKRSSGEWKNIIARHQTALSPSHLERVSKSLDLSPSSLRLYGVGLDDGGYDNRSGTGWISFPMFDGAGKPIGIRLRSEKGDKRAVPGSSNGLFLPRDYDSSPIPEGVCSGDDNSSLLLALPEGPTSSCAGFDLGFRCIGRPSCTGGSAMVRDLLQRGHKQDVIVIADFEGAKRRPDGTPFWPGPEGALQLAGELVDVCARLRVVMPRDAEGKPVKDLRKHLQSGGTGAAIYDLILSAKEATPQWIREQWGKIERNRAAGKGKSV